MTPFESSVEASSTTMISLSSHSTVRALAIAAPTKSRYVILLYDHRGASPGIDRFLWQAQHGISSSGLSYHRVSSRELSRKALACSYPRDFDK
jgi:hypothetical protein